jgi:phage replication-related protein YjqB (UPF0714/DUF867 family)
LKSSLLFILFVMALPAIAQKSSSFKELSSLKKEGLDFEIKLRTGTTQSLVMAIHGGTIEPGTSELAVATAGEKHSYYSFTGLVDDYVGLHLTSTEFDEPRLLVLTQQAKNCLGLHGLKDDQIDFCIGGANAEKRKRYLKLLSEKFPKWRACELCCPPNLGTSSKNIVNKCQFSGVQIEMGSTLRLELKQNSAFMKELSTLLSLELEKK